jgi:hypothetical protein
MKNNTADVRGPEDAYFRFVFSVPGTRKQCSPFLIVTSKEVTSTYYWKDLLTLKPTAIIFQTWPGQWKSDVFSFSIKDLKEYMKTNKIL